MTKNFIKLSCKKLHVAKERLLYTHYHVPSNRQKGSILAPLAGKSKLIILLFYDSKKLACGTAGKSPTSLEIYLPQNCALSLQA